MKHPRTPAAALVLGVMLAVTAALLVMTPVPAASQVNIARATTMIGDTATATTDWDSVTVGTSAPIDLILANVGSAGQELLYAFDGATGDGYQGRMETDDPPLVLKDIRITKFFYRSVTGSVRLHYTVIKR